MAEFKSKEEYEKWKKSKTKSSQATVVRDEKDMPSIKQSANKRSDFKVSKKVVFLILGLIIILIGLVTFLFTRSNTLTPYRALFNQGIDVAKFDPLVRAASKVKASTGVGLTFIQFGQYLQEYATEVMIIKDKVGNDKEKEILDYFSNALEIYNDSKAIWNAKNNDPVSSKILYEYGIASANIEITDEISPIVQKYNLTVKELSFDYKTISETSIQELWGTAGRLIDTATSSLQNSTK
jgi:hypothetical protein